MKYSFFVFLNVLCITGHAQVKMTGMERDRLIMAAHGGKTTADYKIRADEVTRVGSENAGQVAINEPMSCSSPSKTIQMMKMSFKDGSSQDFLIHGTSSTFWIDRYISVAKYKDGKLVSTPHKIIFGMSIGGFRFEVSPEQKKSCPTCDRFKDVAKWEFSESSLHEFMNCPKPAPKEDSPVVSSLRK